MSNYFYILSYCLFILSIHFLSKPKIAYKGNQIAIIAMFIAIIINMPNHHSFFIITSILLGTLTGKLIATKIKMQNLPQLVAILNGFGGLSAGLIGLTEVSITKNNHFLTIFTIILSFITFSGSTASFYKLNNKLYFSSKHIRTLSYITFLILFILFFIPNNQSPYYLISIVSFSLILGFSFIQPIGGADMPIIISILNSLSGWTTVLIGFSLNDYLLIITGTIIGSSGCILTYIMTKAMNRSIIKLLSPNINIITNSQQPTKNYHQATPSDAAFLMENSHKIIIVPGYGMASANAQHELVNLAEILENKYNVDVKFAIHPIAGRMPGHMNVLLAEADANINNIYELKDINQEFQTTDVVYIIGANDITNPLSKTLEDSPIYQMPILEVEQAKKIIFVKRSLSSGYAGIDNPLFYRDNTLMLLGDAKEVTKQIIAALQ